jgi:hypothetical protein
VISVPNAIALTVAALAENNKYVVVANVAPMVRITLSFAAMVAPKMM